MLTLLLTLIYPITIQYERGGIFKIFYIAVIPALLIDVLANYTELSLVFWELPRKGEWTFSTRLIRLQYRTDWRGNFARPIARVLNYIAPSGKHI